MWMIGLSFLLLLAIVMFSIALGVVVLRAYERKKVRGFLAQLDERPQATAPKAPLVERAARSRDRLSALLAEFGLARKMELALQQAGMEGQLGQVVVLGLALMIGGAGIGFALRGVVPEPGGSLAFASLGVLFTIARVRRRRAARIAAFEAQFPDALEFLSRSMLAGHGFTTSLNLLTEESPEPLASVFRQASNEMQLGSPLETALGKLAVEIPLLDVRFFAAAVLLQQTSGGNLAEILNKLAFVVRERFRLSGEVRASSAHGRLTSMVLIALPVLLTVALLVMEPEYLVEFAHQPEGRFLLIAAVCGQVAGHVIIRRIVNIKV
jgi:tight adherence protein B